MFLSVGVGSGEFVGDGLMEWVVELLGGKLDADGCSELFPLELGTFSKRLAIQVLCPISDGRGSCLGAVCVDDVHLKK